MSNSETKGYDIIETIHGVYDALSAAELVIISAFLLIFFIILCGCIHHCKRICNEKKYQRIDINESELIHIK